MKKNKYRNPVRKRISRPLAMPLRITRAGRKKRREKAVSITKFTHSRKKLTPKRITNRVKNLLINPFRFFTIPKILILFFICVTGFSIYKIIRTNYFAAKNFKISGSNHIPILSIEEIFRNNLNKNIFFLSVSNLENELEEMSIYVKSAHVEKILPDTVAINIEEREPLAVWRTLNGAYLIDNEGYILDRAVNENISLEAIQNNLLLEHSTEEQKPDEEDAESEMEGDSDDEDKQSEGVSQSPSINLDEYLERQIDWELKKREREINLLELDFNSYLQLPDPFKKYPQVKVWTDQLFDIGTTIDTEILNHYLKLTTELNNYPFEVEETLIFSESKTLVNFKEGFKVYFKLNSDISNQASVLNFIYSKLRMEGINFQEIDLRFKRPVVRE